MLCAPRNNIIVLYFFSYDLLSKHSENINTIITVLLQVVKHWTMLLKCHKYNIILHSGLFSVGENLPEWLTLALAEIFPI